MLVIVCAKYSKNPLRTVSHSPHKFESNPIYYSSVPNSQMRFTANTVKTMPGVLSFVAIYPVGAPITRMLGSKKSPIGLHGYPW